MSVITVRSQKELDMIPLDTDDIIRIEFGDYWNHAIVKNKYKYSVEARGNSSVEALGNSSVVARENSSVVAWENSSVEARGNSSVVARGNSSVVAWGNSSVEAWGNSSVEALGNSSVVAWGNSSVEAWGNSSVEAWGNSSVVAWGNVQVVDYLHGAAIQISGNARIVYMPKTIDKFMIFYGIKHDKTTAFFYKAVHRIENKYIADRDRSFEYIIGQKAKSNSFDPDPDEDCGAGINFSHLNWALDYGRGWEDLAILEVKVKIKDILLPKHSNGKVRAPEVEVIREVPLEDCGLFGKIINKRLKK